VNKVDRQTNGPRIAMEVFSPLPDKPTPVSDTSRTVSVIGELCLMLSVNVVRIRISLKAKPNDRLLSVLHSAAKNLNLQGR
jgi:hypothetical protein